MEYVPFAEYGFDAAEIGSVDGEQVVSTIGLALVVVVGIAAVIGLIFYLFEAVGLYRMARGCGLSAPGLAFVPIANAMILGQLARRGCQAYGKRGLPYPVLLPLGQVGCIFLSAAASVIGVQLLWNVLFPLIAGQPYYDMPAVMGARVISAMASLLLIGLLLFLVSVATTVFVYMALYQVYRLFSPENTVLYMVLSILLPVTMPFILFAIRNRQPGAPAPTPTAPVGAEVPEWASPTPPKQ